MNETVEIIAVTNMSPREVAIRTVEFGALSIADVILLVLLLHYIRGNWSRRKDSYGVKLAGALAVFTFGQFIRSATLWTQYLWFTAGYPAGALPVGMLTISGLCVFAGLIMLIKTLVPMRWRWHAFAACVASVGSALVIWWIALSRAGA